MSHPLPALDISSLQAAYASGDLCPSELVRQLDAAITAAEPSAVWISRCSLDQLLDYAKALEGKDPACLPLYGIPFAIKDNIDLEGLPTTAACPEYAYVPEKSAFVVQQLIAAGAIPIGKTNLDQFATGLVGVRSPYGIPANAFHPDYIPGGSSSGSAIAVARGWVSFALGTDTAGSGRVPAAFNQLIGHKPSKGLLSCSGVVPACRTLDCVSIFAKNTADAQTVLRVAASFDSEDAYARVRPEGSSGLRFPQHFRFGVPRSDQLKFFGNASAESLFEQAVDRLESLGGERIEVDFQPFLEAARLLYEGPWVAERYVAIEAILKERPEILHPVTRSIIAGGGEASAALAFKSEYRLRALKREADEAMAQVDCMVTPTAGTIYTIKEVEADPVQLNSNLGYYTNFMNLLDFAGTAIPAGLMDSGLPFGITIFSAPFQDEALLELSARFLGESSEETDIPEGWTPVVVCGAHMEGLPLNHQLTERGGRFWKRTRTAPVYDFYALPEMDGFPKRPGLIRRGEGGVSIEVEIWILPLKGFGDFVTKISEPLGMGKVELADGSILPGFIAEASVMEVGEKINEYGSWSAFLSA